MPNARPAPRVRLLIVGLLLGSVVAMVSPTVAHPPPGQPDKPPTPTHLVEPSPNSTTSLWPYTSRARTPEEATLPINLVLRTDAATARYLLTSQGDENWQARPGRETNATIRFGPPGGRQESTPSNESPESATPPPPNRTAGTLANTTTQPETTTAPNQSAPRPLTPDPNGTAINQSATGASGQSTPQAATEQAPSLILNGTTIGWRDTHGGTRYTYVQNETGHGRWLDATYQLQDGAYFGSRTHLRLYEGGRGDTEWTAIQAHREYWDWFSLRHRVGSLAVPQYELEREFMEEWYVTDVSREHYANGGALDSDGWVTVVDFRDRVVVPPKLVLWPFVIGLVASSKTTASALGRELERLWKSDQITRFHLLLVGMVGGLPLLVRAGALAMEGAFPTASPYVVGAPFYLLLILGLPIAAAVFGRRMDGSAAVWLTAVGLGLGILADYAFIGVALIELTVVIHRAGIILALASVAGTAAVDPSIRWRRPLFGLSLLAWMVVVLWPILGLG